MKLLAISHSCVVDVNQHVYRELELLGHEVQIVVPNRWRHEYSAQDFKPARLPDLVGQLIPVPVLNPGSVPLHVYLGRLSHTITNVDPDVIYIEAEPYSVAALQWAWAGSRSRGRIVFFTDQNIAKKYPLPVRLSERYVWNQSSAAVCATATIAHALRTRGYRGDAFIVPHAVDLSNFDVREPDMALRRQLGLRPNVVLYLGRFVEEKGLRVLLEAYDRLPMRDSTSLMCIGGGPLGEACRATPGTVVVEGVRHSDIPRYVALADLLVLPSLTTKSWREQFGRAAIEAMSCGLPVIGSDSGEIPNLVTRTGGGVLVAEGEVNPLRDAVAWLLQDKTARKRFGENGRKQVRAAFSTTAVAHQLATALGLSSVNDRKQCYADQPKSN